MTAERRQRSAEPELAAQQLTLDDWEHEQARGSQPRPEASCSKRSPSPLSLDQIAPLAAALAPRIAAELAARAPAPLNADGSTAKLVTLDELVAELPPAKRPETWKRWLYERTRRGEIPGCVKLGGMLFFQRETAVAWLRAGITTTR
jgi:hypothetical protein